MLVDIRAICVYAISNEKIAHKISKDMRRQDILILPHDYTFGGGQYPDTYFRELPEAYYIILSSGKIPISDRYTQFVQKLINGNKRIIRIRLKEDTKEIADFFSAADCVTLNYGDQTAEVLAGILKGEISPDSIPDIEISPRVPESSVGINHKESTLKTSEKSIKNIQQPEELELSESITEKVPMEIPKDVYESQPEEKSKEPEIEVIPEEPTVMSIKSEVPENSGMADKHIEEEVAIKDDNTFDGDGYKQAEEVGGDSNPEEEYQDPVVDQNEYEEQQPYYEPYQEPYEFNNKGKGKKWWFISLASVLVIGIGVYLIFFATTGKSEREADVVIPETYEIPNQEEFGDEEFIEVGEGGYPIVSSSEAYDIYQNIVGDEILGDDWKSKDFVKELINSGSVYQGLHGSGHIKGNPVSFDAYQLWDGRIIGRYAHSNGTKLDMNGVVAYEGCLVIKLGHGEATSFWVLPMVKMGDVEGNEVEYEGTWGRHDSPTAIKCSFYNPSASIHKVIYGLAYANDESYPFTIEYNLVDGKIEDAKYINTTFDVTVPMTISSSINDGEYFFHGKFRGGDLVIRYSARDEKGVMVTEDHSLPITLSLESPQ